MFEVGFSEILMVGLVALLVIGPERLPKAARLAGFWLGKTRSTIANVKAEIRQELHAEEARQLLQKQAIEETLQEAAKESEVAIQDVHEIMKTISDPKIAQQDDEPA